MARNTAIKKTTKPVGAEINERLHEALDGLRKDVTRVEIWATALGSFSEPVPDYSPSKKFELKGEEDAAPEPEKAGANAAKPANLKG